MFGLYEFGYIQTLNLIMSNQISSLYSRIQSYHVIDNLILIGILSGDFLATLSFSVLSVFSIN